MLEQHFGFRHDPFSAAPDPRFFYNGKTTEALYKSLSTNIADARGQAFLIGEPGTGKTTLLCSLKEDIRRDGSVAYVAAQPGWSFDDVIAACCNGFGLAGAAADRLGQKRALVDFVLSRLAEGALTAVLIDAAEALGRDALTKLLALSQFEQAGRKLLPVVIAGRPELDAMLVEGGGAAPPGRAFDYRMPRLSLEETGRFIRHRLNAAGYRGAELFPPEAVDCIARHAEGIPAEITAICRRALRVAAERSLKAMTPAVVQQAIRGEAARLADDDHKPRKLVVNGALAVGALCLAALGGVYAVWESVDRPPPPQSESAPSDPLATELHETAEQMPIQRTTAAPPAVEPAAETVPALLVRVRQQLAEMKPGDDGEGVFQTYQRIVTLAPDDPAAIEALEMIRDAYIERARIAQQNRQWEEARLLLQRARRLLAESATRLSSDGTSGRQ